MTEESRDCNCSWGWPLIIVVFIVSWFVFYDVRERRAIENGYSQRVVVLPHGSLFKTKTIWVKDDNNTTSSASLPAYGGN